MREKEVVVVGGGGGGRAETYWILLINYFMRAKGVVIYHGPYICIIFNYTAFSAPAGRYILLAGRVALKLSLSYREEEKESNSKDHLL